MMYYWQNFWGIGGQPVDSAMMWGIGGFLFVLLIAWSLIWKGIALWKAARAGSKIWFVALLIINTVGILDILYVYVFSKEKKSV